jgi:hypothetical protein
VQVDPIKPKLKAPVTKRLKLQCDKLLSSFAFNFKLRHYMMVRRLKKDVLTQLPPKQREQVFLPLPKSALVEVGLPLGVPFRWLLC